MKTYKRLSLITLLFVLMLVLVASMGVCYAEEVAPSEPPTEVAPPSEVETPPSEDIPNKEEVQTEIEDTLKDKLWFLDEPLQNLIISIVGSLSGVIVALVTFFVSLKKIKDSVKALHNKEVELSDVQHELENTKATLVTLKGEMDKWMTDNTDNFKKLADMMQVGFCSDPARIVDGTADTIKQIAGVESEENES